MLLAVHRFCGIKEPHHTHVFYRDYGAWMGSANYECPGWDYAEIRSDHV